MLYDIVACEHRLWMDLNADQSRRDVVSPFVELMWRRGRAHEDEAISQDGLSILNLRRLPVNERLEATADAMRRAVPMIYGGRIAADDLLGEPDLLRFEDGGYVPGDIKSGAGEEGHDEDKKLKKHYGVQLALYVDVLERLGLSPGRRAFVWDVHGDEVPYDLIAAKGKRTPTSLWDDYLECLTVAREIISGVRNPGPAYATSTCRLCVWLTSCLEELERVDDLTLLPGLGRSTREPFLSHVKTAQELSERTPQHFIDEHGKSILRGVGPDSIAKFHARAVLKRSGGSPYLKSAFVAPDVALELFFDIETDPMRDTCYLHGFVERRNGDVSTERYIGFFSESPTVEGERAAFSAAWNYVGANQPSVLYIYSKYERTWWRSLQQKYPDVCDRGEVEALFASALTIDLLDVVQTLTEWPTRDHSIKTLATFLGFKWRDAHPSGAASIEWYDRYCLGESDAKERILEYNEDDCRAMRVLLDGILKLPLAQIS